MLARFLLSFLDNLVSFYRVGSVCPYDRGRVVLRICAPSIIVRVIYGRWNWRSLNYLIRKSSRRAEGESNPHLVRNLIEEPWSVIPVDTTESVHWPCTSGRRGFQPFNSVCWTKSIIHLLVKNCTYPVLFFLFIQFRLSRWTASDIIGSFFYSIDSTFSGTIDLNNPYRW